MGGDAAHGAAHGSMGHGEVMGSGTNQGSLYEWEDLGVLIPTHLMLFSIAASLFTAVVLRNHASLTEGKSQALLAQLYTSNIALTVLSPAVGPTTYSLRPRLSQTSSKSRLYITLHNAILSNPFSLTVLVFAAALAAASILIPAQQLAPLDKVVALFQSIAMFYIAYPAAVATGKTLLQTAPSSGGTGMAGLKRAIEEVSKLIGYYVALLA